MAIIPINIVSQEIEIKKSRFIGKGYPITSTDNAREILKALKTEYSDARHVCYGFSWGPNATHLGMGDDGEPNGTAGRPILEVVKGSGIENILVAVIRYFGGTKLGTGGLVKAYTQISKMVIENIETQEYVEKTAFRIIVPYESYQNIIKSINEFQGSVLKEIFNINIQIDYCVPKENEIKHKQDLENILKGNLIISDL